MIRYKLVVEYDGTPFSGWQRQDNALSVQGVLEDAIEKLSGQKVVTFAAGRTDAGVHATHQVIHFDLNEEHSIHKMIRSLNFFMRPHPVCIVYGEIVDSEFHARFSARSRSYVYKILNRHYETVLLKDRVWHVHEPLDVGKMQDATKILVGTHDFTSFRSVHCQSKSPVKTIASLEVSREADLITIKISAPSFLHNQVRIITGALKYIGEGRWDEAKLKSVLDAKDRTMGPETGPACGLYLCGVSYAGCNILLHCRPEA